MEYIKDELKTVDPNKTVIINNKCENPIEVGTGLIFHKDGTYIVSVYNGKITVQKTNDTFEKLDEISPEVLQECRNNEEKIKAKAEELNEEFIAQKRFQIKQLEAEIEKLKFDYKISKLIPPLPPPPIYPAYVGFNKCGEEK